MRSCEAADAPANTVINEKTTNTCIKTDSMFFIATDESAVEKRERAGTDINSTRKHVDVSIQAVSPLFGTGAVGPASAMTGTAQSATHPMRTVVFAFIIRLTRVVADLAGSNAAQRDRAE